MTHAASTLSALADSSLGVAMRDALDVEALLSDAIAIQQIPAPTFYESQRAAYVARRFETLGLRDVAQDALHNVYGRLPGADARLRLARSPATLSVDCK